MTADRPVLLVLSASHRVIEKAVGLGLDVVHLEAPSLAEPELEPLCLRTVRTDLLDVPAVVELAAALDREFDFAGVLSNHEPACPAAEAAALHLGLTAAGKGVTALLRDKARTREALDAAGAGTCWSRLRSPADIHAVARTAGYPVIVKPADGSASLGVLKVNGPDEADAAWEQARRTLRNEHRYHDVLPVTDYLVEPFVEGEEYSVETFSREGRHEVCAVVRKVTGTAFVETGHIVPAGLDAELADAVAATVRLLLDGVGLREGPAHTEVIVRDGEVHLLESHARTGGDGIPALVRLVTGRDLELDMIAHCAGLPLPRPGQPVAPAAAKAYLVARAAGRVRAVTGLETAAAAAGVRTAELWVAPGDPVRPATASWDRLGEFVAVGATARDAWAAADGAVRALTLDLEAE
ncbi:ATP-grasp domain-containing protein [Streptomyces sp. NPDC047017]|uniref:ATP-grasp domain-containing protein n=1 Tax=Streptomyces sp. NPDC047017 TaxID=3155024 RepID=UPI0033D49CDB